MCVCVCVEIIKLRGCGVIHRGSREGKSSLHVEDIGASDVQKNANFNNSKQKKKICTPSPFLPRVDCVKCRSSFIDSEPFSLHRDAVIKKSSPRSGVALWIRTVY